MMYAFVLVKICSRLQEPLDDLINARDSDLSRGLFREKKGYNRVIYYKYQRKFVEIGHENIENEWNQEDHPSSSAHELLLHNILDHEEDFVDENTHAHEEAPHASQEDQVDADEFDENIEASIYPPHEDKALVIYSSFQISEFDDVFYDNFERVDLGDKPLSVDKMESVFTSPFFEDKGTLGHEVMNITFHIVYHSRDIDCWKIYGDPIYDDFGDVPNENIADF